MVAALVTLRFRYELKMTAFATVRLTALMTLCTFLAACSSDAPLSPTPRTDADVAGAWRGTMRITSVTGEQCAAELQFLVGTSSEFRLTLTKTGGSLTGTLDMSSGSCELAGGILPGLLSLGLAAAHGIHRGTIAGVQRTRFDVREAAAALWFGKWEVLLPVVVLGAFFGGYATIVETSAITAIYACAVQVSIHRNIRVHEIRRVFADCVMTIGGVLIILAVARGFSSYLIDAQMPAALIDWTRESVGNKYIFLLGLNVFLLIVGCVMDIFSALFVVVPLIAPVGAEFGIHPVHLGIIFIANLELGYLTPPVGLNLFLASYRFDRPLLEVYRASIPMLIILGIGVLLITYLPWLTTALLPLVGDTP